MSVMSDALLSRDVTLQLTDREDGGIRVRSRELPGLLLGGSDPERIWSCVGFCVQGLLRNNEQLDVRSVIGPMTVPTERGDVVLRVEYAPVSARAAA